MLDRQSKVVICTRLISVKSNSTEEEEEEEEEKDELVEFGSMAESQSATRRLSG